MSALGSKDRCAVVHAPGYVPGDCAGEIHLYGSLTTTGEWWLCDADAKDAPRRGVPVKRLDEANR